MEEITWYAYILKCENDRYYVGIAHDFEQRIKKHIIGKGAILTKLYPPISVERVYLLPTLERSKAEYFENVLVLKIFKEKKKVGGGNFVIRDDSVRNKSLKKALFDNKIRLHGKTFDLNYSTEKFISKPVGDLNKRIFENESPFLLISKYLEIVDTNLHLIKNLLTEIEK